MKSDALLSVLNRFVCSDSHFSAKVESHYYVGFWQNADMVSSVIDILKSQLVLDSKECTSQYYAQMIGADENSVFIHVRRGDYVGSEFYFDLSSCDYYRNAIEYIRSNVPNPSFYVFSDDIEWAKTYFTDYSFRYVQYEGQTTLGDLYLLSICKNAIIANSSYSWWGAALGNKQVVVRPSSQYSDNIHNSMYPQKWIAI